jgi:hypothetical protein
MASPKQLLSTIESTLLNPSPPSAAERVELMHAIRSSLPSLQALLFYPVRSPLLINIYLSLHIYIYIYLYIGFVFVASQTIGPRTSRPVERS